MCIQFFSDLLSNAQKEHKENVAENSSSYFSILVWHLRISQTATTCSYICIVRSQKKRGRDLHVAVAIYRDSRDFYESKRFEIVKTFLYLKATRMFKIS